MLKEGILKTVNKQRQPESLITDMLKVPVGNKTLRPVNPGGNTR